MYLYDEDLTAHYRRVTQYFRLILIYLKSCFFRDRNCLNSNVFVSVRIRHKARISEAPENKKDRIRFEAKNRISQHTTESRRRTIHYANSREEAHRLIRKTNS
jgi:hypothetical protein